MNFELSIYPFFVYAYLMFQRILKNKLLEVSTQYPIVTVTGPRQSGKTTLCRQTFPDKDYVNLENPDSREFAQTDPRGFLMKYKNGAIIDEIQRVPSLSSYLQPLVDEVDKTGQFILTGSQQFEIMSTITQSLAGRTALLKLLPFSLDEIKTKAIKHDDSDNLVYTGFYPRIYKSNINPTQFYGDYVETYVERDIRQLIAIKDLSLFIKFIKLCAGRIGQLLNLTSLGNDVGISHTTARSWLTLLEASFIVYQLQPWYVNLSKRQIKSSKLYFYDVGLASYLLGIENKQHLYHHPLKGNLFENLIVMEALKHRYHHGLRSNIYFWRDTKGNEVDLLIEKGNHIYPIEIKAGATIHSDFFKGLKKFSNKVRQSNIQSTVVYGGLDSQHRSMASIYNYQEFTSEFLSGLE